MFKSKEKDRFSSFAADSVSIVASGMKINGDIESEHDMRIDGTISGHVFCKAKVVLGKHGFIEGDLHALNADILGKVTGNVVVKDLLCLKSKCVVSGDLNVGHLEIEPDAEFNGKCTMNHQSDSPEREKTGEKAMAYESLN